MLLSYFKLLKKRQHLWSLNTHLRLLFNKNKMDPSLYMEYKRIPNLGAKNYISELASSTDWRDSSLDIVMDIGCGAGVNSTYWIDHYFPNIRRLIGIDIDSGMIDLAKQQNKKEKIEFYVADIMEKESLKEWEGRVSRIASRLVLHRANDQNQAFRNVFDLLEPSGQAALQFILEGPHYFAYKDLLNTPKWNPILKPTNFVFPEAMIKKYDAAHYNKMFEDIGFIVSSCVTKQLAYSHESDEECKNFLMSLHSIGDVSSELQEEYKKDLFEQDMKYTERDSEGRAVHRHTVLEVLLYKEDSRRKL